MIWTSPNKLHSAQLHLPFLCFHYILRKKRLTFLEISLGLNFTSKNIINQKWWKIRFLTLKMGVDLYMSSTYTRVNTVVSLIYCRIEIETFSLVVYYTEFIKNQLLQSFCFVLFSLWYSQLSYGNENATKQWNSCIIRTTDMKVNFTPKSAHCTRVCCSSGPSLRTTNWSTVSTTNITKREQRENSIHSHISPSQPRSEINHSKEL